MLAVPNGNDREGVGNYNALLGHCIISRVELRNFRTRRSDEECHVLVIFFARNIVCDGHLTCAYRWSF